jgi:transcriptional regulator with XRE-family HTH domain
MPRIHEEADDLFLSVVGRRLAELRVAANITQAELCAAAGVSKSTIERLESGKSVQITSFLRYARALGALDQLESVILNELTSPKRKRAASGRHRAKIGYG